MASGAFAFDDPESPTLGVPELIALMQQIDSGAYLQMVQELEDEQGERRAVLNWLYANDKRLFNTLENICDVFQSANFHAHQQIRILMTEYKHYKNLEAQTRLLRQKLAQLEQQNEPESPKKTSRSKREREKKKSGEKELMLESPQKLQAVASEVEEVNTADPAVWFSKFEPWVPDFPLANYVHFVPKNTPKLLLQNIASTTGLQTIFHVPGAWSAEQLKHCLDEQGFTSYCIKLKRGGADMEPLAYKVLSTAPIERFIPK
jgi:hypothetical protein